MQLSTETTVAVVGLGYVGLPLAVAFGRKFRTIGYDLSAETAHPGDSISVRLVWQALAEMPASYSVFLHLTDPARRSRAAATVR